MPTVINDLAGDTFCLPIIPVIQFNRQNELEFKRNDVFWCRESAEMCIQEWIHNLWKRLGEEKIKCERCRYLRKKVIDV